MTRSLRQISIHLFLVAIFCSAIASESWAGDDPQPWQQPVATTVEQSRDVTDPAADDFLRLIFVPSGASVTSLGLHRARVFMAPTSFFMPGITASGGESEPLTLDAVVNFTGGQYSATNDLAAMRCKLPDPAHSAVVASWPRVFAAITSDLTGYQCKPMPPKPSAENQVYCLAQSYRDQPDLMVVKPLADATATGLAMMQVSDSTGRTGADVLASTYGIGLGFSGLGFSVAGSLDTSLNAEQSLQRSVVTEYLVKNATLNAAGCSCIQVHAYSGRDSGPIDPTYIAQKGRIGADGKCVRVARLGVGSSFVNLMSR